MNQAKTAECKLPVKVGLGTLEHQLTRAQARRYGDRNMPADLRRAGFQTCVFETDVQIHGAHYLRVSYGK